MVVLPVGRLRLYQQFMRAPIVTSPVCDSSPYRRRRRPRHVDPANLPSGG